MNKTKIIEKLEELHKFNKDQIEYVLSKYEIEYSLLNSSSLHEHAAENNIVMRCLNILERHEVNELIKWLNEEIQYAIRTQYNSTSPLENYKQLLGLKKLQSILDKIKEEIN